MADMARLMLRDCNTDLQEILECWLCYKHSNDKTLRNWFIKPCKPPHELVYARQKGYPYWPAKVSRILDRHRACVQRPNPTWPRRSFQIMNFSL